MRRNEESLPMRRGSEGGISPWERENWMSPSSFFSTSPWQMMRRMQEDMDRVFSQFFSGREGAGGTLAPTGQQEGMRAWAPSVDISQDDREWHIEAEMPGVKPENIDVRIQDHHLIIEARMLQENQQPQGSKGSEGNGGQAQGQQGGQQQGGQRQYAYRERRSGFMRRVLPLPENADEEKIQCSFQDGVLTLRLPKTEQTERGGRRIPIQAGAPQGQSGRTEGTGAAAPSQARAPSMAGAKGGEAGSPQKKSPDQS